MKSIILAISALVVLGELMPQQGLGHLVFLETKSGDEIEIGVNSDDSFGDVIDRLQTYFQSAETLGRFEQGDEGLPVWSLTVSHAGLSLRAKEVVVIRDFHAVLTKQQKEDIGFVVSTLAWDSWTAIAGKNSALNTAKEHIENVHPLIFLEVIFSNDKLIAGIAAIKERNVPMVKKTFFKRLIGSLQQEDQRKNLLPFVDEFAERLNISKKKILPALESKNYTGFVDLLIELKPREGADRHIM